jgi:hypothetical protein
MICSSSTLDSGLAFSRTLPWRKNGCWGMMLILDRTWDLETFEMSIPSMRMVPLLSSSIRRSAETRDDLPLSRRQYFLFNGPHLSVSRCTNLPVLPHRATFSPGRMLRLMSLSTGSEKALRGYQYETKMPADISRYLLIGG